MGTPNFSQVHCGDETVNLLIKVSFSVGILNFSQVHCGGETRAGERVLLFFDEKHLKSTLSHNSSLQLLTTFTAIIQNTSAALMH